jgi:hypothetical protein
MKIEHRQNFKNHSQQIILYSYIQYFGFIALTPVSNTALHRFASPLRNALCSSAVAISIQSVVHTRLPLYATHCLALRILSKSCRSLVLYRVYRIPRTVYTIPSSAGYSQSAVPFSYEKVLAALTSEASRVVTLQGAVALNYNIMILKQED